LRGRGGGGDFSRARAKRVQGGAKRGTGAAGLKKTKRLGGF